MSLNDKVKAIESKTFIQPEWFYHAFHYEEDMFTDILIDGIKCRKLTSKQFKKKYNHIGHNGNHYISLSKCEMVSPGYSSFLYYQDKPAFIISDINPKKCIYSFEHTLLERTRWPIRYSGFHDEYQEYRQIPFEKLVGLRCSILQWYKENYVFYLRSLKEMILFMKEHNISLPIYDYTRNISSNSHLVDQDAYLEICDDLLEDLGEQKIKTPNF